MFRIFLFCTFGFLWRDAVEAAPLVLNSGGAANGFWQQLNNFLLPHEETRTILHAEETKYYSLRVEEDDMHMRYLIFLPKNGVQGIWDPANLQLLKSNYLKLAVTALTSFPTPPKRVLFIGLGAGILPTLFRHYFPTM